MKSLFFLSMITGSQYITRFLSDHNIRTLFGYSGGSNLHLLDEISKKQDTFQFFVNRHEQFVGHSAEGFAKASGKIGCAIVTSGPGITNMITPLQDALSDHIPMLCISGQVSSSSLGTRSFQEVDAIGLTKKCTKWNALVKTTQDLPLVLHEALFHLHHGQKGPVHIDICSDVFSSEMEEIPISDIQQIIIPRKCVNQNLMKLIVKNIVQSKKPVLIVGKGATHAYEKIRRFSEKYLIPVTTTLHGIGIVDEYQSTSLKMLGMHGTAYANKAVQNADLIIGIGNRFDDRTIGKPSMFGMQAKKNYGIIHINLSPVHLEMAKKVIDTDLSISMDSNEFMSYLETNCIMSPKIEWYHEILYMKKTFPLQFQSTTRLKIQDVLIHLSPRLQNKNYMITTGVGNHQMMTAQYLNWNEPNRLMTSGSLGTMGVGLPFAIGAQIAHPDRTVICIDGDGSFMMSLQELASITEYNLPIKIFIMNDGHLQMVTTWQKLFYKNQIFATKPKNPSFVSVGKAFGITSFYCDQKQNLAPILDQALSIHDRPVLVEFNVEPDICLPFVKPGSSLEDMLLQDE